MYTTGFHLHGLKWYCNKEMIRYTVLKAPAKSQIRKGVDGTHDLHNANVNNARRWLIAMRLGQLEHTGLLRWLHFFYTFRLFL